MIGQKLHQLTNELSIQENKAIIQHCNHSSDKRCKILKKYISIKSTSLEDRNVLLHNEILSYWPTISIKELDLKKRRMISFFTDEIEKIILSIYFERNISSRQLLLAEAKASNGNVDLLNNYYHKAYQKASEEENEISKIVALKGKIRMGYAAHSEKELQNLISLNERFFDELKRYNEKSISEYYENISNVFIEKKTLMYSKKKQFENKIIFEISKIDSPLIKTSLYFSLAKICHGSIEFEKYFDLAKKNLRAISVKNYEYFDLERKMVFFELRLKFFSGAKPETLISISNTIINGNTIYSVINNNTMFYKILSIILKDNIVLAKTMIEENSIYFKGDSQLLKDFLNGIIAEKTDDIKKALSLLQPLMYTSNYFFAIFSRLTVIKIKLTLPFDSTLDSLIESTARYLKVNENISLGREANQYVLRFFKNITLKQRSKTNPNEYVPILSSFHQYLLSDFKILVGQK